jgi:hypothetical protein
MFMVTLFTAVERSKQPQCLSMNDQINKMFYIHTMEHYSIIKRKGMKF